MTITQKTQFLLAATLKKAVILNLEETPPNFI
jgi:hypothetical protein